VLGITYERMRAKAVKLIGERAVTVIETLVKYLRTLISGGPAALWEQIKSDLSDLKGMVIDAIQNYIVTTVAQRAIAKLVTLFNPAGAIIQAIMAIYDTVTFLIEKASQIMALVEAVINSVSAIASGAIGGAANWIEQALARTIPVVIGFLAQFVGLGKVSKKVKEFIQKVQAKVDAAIDKAIAKVVAVVKKLVGKLTGKKEKPEKPDEKKGQANRPVVTVPFSLGSSSHELTLEPHGDSLTVLMASGNKLPLNDKFKQAHIAIDNFKHYMGSVTDPVVKADYTANILPAIQKLQDPSISSFNAIYDKRFPRSTATGPGTPLITDAQAKALVQPLVGDADKLLAQLKAWAAATGIPDLDKASIDKTLREKGDAIWRKSFEKTKADIIAAIGAVSYKGAAVEFTGSSFTGWKGPHKGQTHFNPADFDVDMYVVHPADFANAQKAGAKVVSGKMIFPDLKFTPALVTTSGNAVSALTKKFPGIVRVANSAVVLRASKP
jgi:hypothetical protein